MAAKNPQLSEVLRRLREAKGLSLRQVEKKTGVSNAYLSQIETGKIGEPSPHILHKLSEVYEISYQDLMKLAGYIKEKEGEHVKDKVMSDVAFSAYSELSPEEKEEVLTFLNFVRSRKKR
jgi:transcriptional regulator with XRE-family HTH domain